MANKDLLEKAKIDILSAIRAKGSATLEDLVGVPSDLHKEAVNALVMADRICMGSNYTIDFL